jgi:hypothetical protein
MKVLIAVVVVAALGSFLFGCDSSKRRFLIMAQNPQGSWESVTPLLTKEQCEFERSRIIQPPETMCIAVDDPRLVLLPNAQTGGPAPITPTPMKSTTS